MINFLRLAKIKFKSLKINKLHLIFICFCIFGCFYHVIKMTQVFLKFQTKTDVSLDSESQITVPMVSMCAALQSLYKGPFRQTRKNSIEVMIDSIYNMTYDMSQVFFY